MKEFPTLTNSKPYFTKIRSTENEILENLGAPHTDSFNYMLTEGIDECIRNILPVKFELPNGDRIELTIQYCTISRPKVPMDEIKIRTKQIYPSECRQRAISYKGMCTIRIGWKVNGMEKPEIDKEMGELPIMIKSNACNLQGFNGEQMIERGEHENEWGGYFVIKGHEKIIRLLLMTRKNFPIAIKRSTWKNRGTHFSDCGVIIRTVKTDQTATNNVLHFINNGTAKYMFSYRKTLSYIPVMLILKALTNFTDDTIYKQLLYGFETDQYYTSCLQRMLREVHEVGIHTQDECKEYLGAIFRPKLYDLHAWCTNIETADFILNELILIHLDDHYDKYNLIIFMVQKLFQCLQNKNIYEGPDGVMMQEVLLGGHLYQKVLKDRLETWLQYLKLNIMKRMSNDTMLFTTTEMTHCVKQTTGIEKTFDNFLSTGNLASKSGLGLMQNSGLVIMAENINRMRYMSHFRAVHRGSFFVEMRTTEARQLLPDAWGFICPVHTPDGTPCGLLNHFTEKCVVSNSPVKTICNGIAEVLVNLGMIPINRNGQLFINVIDHYVVMLEGKIIGYIRQNDSTQIVHKLRLLKIEGIKIPSMTEIVMVPIKMKGQYPGLYLFVGAARMMRPVLNLLVNKIEYIGTFEQVYMDICVSLDEAYPNVTTHMELSKTSFLSNLAKLIPLPDCNQSPRNMYQCQMGKQTMGTPCQNWPLQSETKLYRLQTPTAPLFRPVHHDNIDLDDFGMGTNAIVAVISYTGYDMEDAMIINKSAHERGFAHGSIYKSEFIELKNDSYFVRNPHNLQLNEFIDNDGLPYRGRILKYMTVFYCYYDMNESVYKSVNFFGKEECVVDNVRLCGDFNLKAQRKVCITYRIQRNPSVGDKFASRAGQKGICSQKWPAEDLPFTETGLIPDIIFNPHGFPSRMTIAMMIETMAGKSGSLHGLVHDATPFRFTEKDTAIDYFGRLLEKGGYNYYGTERVYSGIDGREMTADIFFGVVHYQRLRHMVSDKWQVRSTGPIDATTHQPIKGRKRGGGVRFGEMERDALISHGATFLLQDRLFNCSDKIMTLICKNCGTLLGPIKPISKNILDDMDIKKKIKPTCKLCEELSDIGYLEVPYIFKFLVAQLSAVNINVKLDFTTI